MATVLVTGAAGFLGSHLCDKLIAEGYHVIGIDNLYTGSKANIEHLAENENFRFIEHDIVNPLNIYISTEDIVAIYNFACPASPPLYQRNPVYTLDINYVGTKNMLDLALKNKSRFMQASTSEIYGNPLEHPQTESYWGNVNSFGIRSCYDEGKRISETLTFEYARKYGINVKLIRIFNTYGPRMAQKDGRVVSNFIVAALKGAPITIYGDGNQTRSFCFGEDLVEGIYRMMESDPAFRGPVNLGNPTEFTIKQLAEMVIRLTGSSSEIVYRDLPKDDPVRRKPDISLAKEKLDWAPAIPLEEGITRTIEYFRARVKV